MNQIGSDFFKGIKQLGEETGEKLVSETGRIAESIITAKDLLGNIVSMSDEEMSQKKADDEERKNKEMSEIKSKISGRSVESELEKIRQEKEKSDKERERIEMENKKRLQVEEERRRQENMNMEMMVGKKHKKDKGGNKHKTQQPDQTQMSQTSEYKGKID